MYKKILLTVSVALLTGLAIPHQGKATSAYDLPEISGAINSDAAGDTVASGDINGDGYDDLLIGASGYHEFGGAVYLFYGSETLITDTSVTTADATFDATDAQYAGSNLTTGDFNDDGYDDIVINARNYAVDGSTVGAVYIIYGQADALTSFQLSTKNTTRIRGDQANDALDAVGAADLNGDGVDDLIIGCPQYGSTNYGAIYVIYGTTGAELDDATLSSSNIILVGQNTSDYFGAQVSNAGDVNGDGFEDVVIAAPRDEEGLSRIWLLYGQSAEFSAGTTNISTIGVRFNNEHDDDQLGTVAYGGDINNDGYDDLLAAATQYSDTLATNGAVYTLLGKSSHYTNQSIATGQQYLGIAAHDQVGTALTSGQTNDDRYSDIVMSAQVSNTAQPGIIYLIYGEANPISQALSLQLSIEGRSDYDEFGNSLASGDLNHDGYDEIIIGAPGRNSFSGSVYILYSTVDTDGDGIAGTDGVIFDGVDTNDNDFDNDGITDDLDTGVDTTYEIADDGYDNDGDGVVDETTNTVEENGTHTGYDSLDPNDSDTAAANLSTVHGRKNGKIKVTYSDDSSYVYTIFNHTISRKTKVKQYSDLGYYVVYQANGKKVALVNAYTGEVYNRKTVNRKARRYVGLLVTDVRGDGHTEAVVTNRKGTAVQVAIFKVNTSRQTLKKRSSLKLTDANIAVTKTKKKGKKVLLRNRSSRILYRLNTNSHYVLSSAE